MSAATVIAWYVAPVLLLMDAALAGLIVGRLWERHRPVAPGPCPSELLGIALFSSPAPIFRCNLRATHAGLHESSNGNTWSHETAALREQWVRESTAAR